MQTLLADELEWAMAMRVEAIESAEEFLRQYVMVSSAACRWT